MAIATSTEQVEGPGSLRFMDFWREWTFSKGLVFTWMAIWGFGTPFYDSAEAIAPAWWEPLAALVMFLCVVYWLFVDSRRFREVAAQYGGLALYVLWPLLLPVYLFHSRGWRRAAGAMLFTLLVWLSSIVLGAISGTLVQML